MGLHKVNHKVNQDSQTKKSQGGNISPVWGNAPTVPIRTKICMVCRLPDVITYAKFQVEIFRGYDFTGGRISHYPIDFCMGLTTVQRDCAAYDSINDVLCVSSWSQMSDAEPLPVYISIAVAL